MPTIVLHSHLFSGAFATHILTSTLFTHFVYPVFQSCVFRCKFVSLWAMGNVAILFTAGFDGFYSIAASNVFINALTALAMPWALAGMVNVAFHQRVPFYAMGFPSVLGGDGVASQAVYSASHCLQVHRIDTMPCFAQMVYFKSGWNSLHEPCIAQPMSRQYATSIGQATVATPVRLNGAFPARNTVIKMFSRDDNAREHRPEGQSGYWNGGKIDDRHSTYSPLKWISGVFRLGLVLLAPFRAVAIVA